MLKHDDRLRFGVCWYPDQWPKQRWAEDLRLMREAGLECIRWGEGSWTLMQPAVDRFDWSLVDEVLELCARQGLGVILGTPTYAAPAWLEEAHPEIIARREHGASYAEILELQQPETEALARYANGWFEGSAAVTRRRCGAGAVVHCGAALNDAVLDWLWR